MKDELELLEYTTILQKLADYTHTTAARRRALELRPLHDLNRIRLRSGQIADASAMLEQSSPPLTSLDGLEEALPRLELGDILSPRELSALASFLTSCRRMQLYLQRMKECAPELAAWQASLESLPELVDEVERCIRGEQVDDRATPTLRAIRRQLEALNERMREKLESLL
ncbi:MAG: hypothetical protein ACI4XW_03485, partial [Candidatus Spyradocola sp.]